MISSLPWLGTTFCENFVDWKEKQKVVRVNARNETQKIIIVSVEEKSLKSSLLTV